MQDGKYKELKAYVDAERAKAPRSKPAAEKLRDKVKRWVLEQQDYMWGKVWDSLNLTQLFKELFELLLEYGRYTGGGDSFRDDVKVYLLAMLNPGGSRAAQRGRLYDQMTRKNWPKLEQWDRDRLAEERAEAELQRQKREAELRRSPPRAQTPSPTPSEPLPMPGDPGWFTWQQTARPQRSRSPSPGLPSDAESEAAEMEEEDPEINPNPYADLREIEQPEGQLIMPPSPPETPEEETQLPDEELARTEGRDDPETEPAQ